MREVEKRDELVSEWELNKAGSNQQRKVKWDAQLVTFNRFVLIFVCCYCCFISFNSKTIYFFAVQLLAWFIFVFAEIYAPFFANYTVSAPQFFVGVVVFSLSLHCNKNRKFDRLNRFSPLVRQEMQLSIVIGYEICALCITN